ncbi:hypothetical protein BV378_20390 [Nostoc sp. RF31YmG]|jgi:hypothetical protein|nr:hypothetical protein BV378_20390 [Nostoc sp. RF31YmG]
MIDDLPQFEPLPVIEPLPEEEKELFYPKWRCFCCQDSGLVRPLLVKLIMPNYDDNRDKWVACQNLTCNQFNERWSGVPLQNFDTRFLPAICQKLDLKSREDWRKTVQRQVDIRALSLKLAMPGSQERTEQDNQEVQQRKQEIESISPQQWKSMRKAYLGADE